MTVTTLTHVKKARRQTVCRMSPLQQPIFVEVLVNFFFCRFENDANGFDDQNSRLLYGMCCRKTSDGSLEVLLDGMRSGSIS